MLYGLRRRLRPPVVRRSKLENAVTAMVEANEVVLLTATEIAIVSMQKTAVFTSFFQLP
jgi:hypothetical protein